MTSLTRDPLLAIAKGLLLFLMAVLVVAIVACLVAVPGMLVYQHAVFAALTEELHGIDLRHFIAAIVVILLLFAVLLGLLWKVFQLLKRIVDTVGEGDPFVPVNARRLTLMAWLVLAIQVLTVPLGAIGAWMAQFADGKSLDIDVDQGISGNGLLLMLVLFILARVFRHGAMMREELEATV